jgi:uncharacterized protein (DUF433 family)
MLPPPVDSTASAGTVETMDRVVTDHRIMGGVPCVRGTRIPVATILGLLAEELTPAEVLTLYPQLVLEDVLACEQYAGAPRPTNGSCRYGNLGPQAAARSATAD